MNIPFRALTASIGLALLFRPVMAASAKPPAPVLEWSFYVLLIFAACVIAFVFLKTSKKRKETPLSSMLDETRRPINTVRPEDSISGAIRLMTEQNIGAVLVMDEDKLAGIFTERDALNKVLAKSVDPNNTKIMTVMTTDPVCVDPATTIGEAMSIVTDRRVRHLPVIHNGKLVGIVSSGDLTHWLVQDREDEIRELIDIAAHTRPR